MLFSTNDIVIESLRRVDLNQNRPTQGKNFDLFQYLTPKLLHRFIRFFHRIMFVGH